MKTFFTFLGILVIIVLLGIIAFSPRVFSPDAESPEIPPITYQVSATIFPLYDITRILGGDDIQTQLILPAGSSPHTFELSPASMNTLTSSQLVFAIGHGLDDWATQTVPANRLVIVDRNIALRPTASIHEEHEDHDDEHEEDHEHGPIDPHYWLSGENGKLIAETIAMALKSEFPEFAQNIEERLAAYLVELQAAHETTYTIMNEVGNKHIVTMHDAWYYFAEAYGLTIVDTYTPSAGKDPLPRDLAHMQEIIDTYALQTFYAERQTPTSTLQAFLEDTQLQLATLDELGGLEGTRSYIDLLLYNANVFAGQP